MDDAEARVRPGRNLDYPFEARPELGQSVEVAPGVHWVRMRLPMQLNHIKLWLLEDGDGWTVVDSGIRNEETANAWKQLFAGPMGDKPVKRVIVTHMHPDHIGLAGWLVRKFDVELWITRTEFLMCRNLVADTGQERRRKACGSIAPPVSPMSCWRTTRRASAASGTASTSCPMPIAASQRVAASQIGGREWRVVVGNGHSPEHACLWCPEANLVISGDQLLPRISSNVSVHPTEPEANPLQDWLDSCAKLRSVLPEDVLVLPSHNEPFRGAHLRLSELIEGHEAGMDKLAALCVEPQRAVDVFPALFRAKITGGNYGMATGESIAHLNCLRFRGRMERQADAGRGGVV